MRAFALVLALSLGACSAPQQIADDYRDTPRTTFTYENSTYRIFDKPSAGKLVITPSVASAMGTSLLRRMTFGTYGKAAPQAAVEAAVASYLTSNGRKCTADSATQVRKPQWEFTYTCEIKFTATL